MEVASRAGGDRVWRSTQKAGTVRRGCAVRVVAFNEGRRTPATAPGVAGPVLPATTAPATTAANALARPAHGTPLLSLDRVDSLSPAALAAALVDYAQHVEFEAASVSPGTAAGAAVDSRVFGAVARRLTHSVYDFDAVSLVDVLHAYSCAGQGRSNRDVLAICCVVLSGKVDELPPAALTRLAAVCAAMDLQATDLLAALRARATEPEVLSQFTAPDLAALLVALSQLQHRSPTLYAEAAEVLAAELAPAAARGAAAGSGLGAGRQAAPSLGPEQAVAVVWAFAAAGHYHRQLFDAAGTLLMDHRLDELDGNTLAKITWSYATVRVTDESHRGLWDRDLFDSIAGMCLERGVVAFPPRAQVTLLWSFASIPHYDGPLFDALSTALAPQLAAGAVGPSDLVAVAWSVMRVGHVHGGLMAALGDAALAAVELLDGEDLTAIAMAFPAAKAYNEGFFKYLVSEAQARPQFFGQVALLDIIRLISRVQHRDPDYYGPALEVLLEHVHKAFLDAPVDKVGCMNPFRFG